MSATTFAVNAMPTVCRGGRASASAARRVSLRTVNPTVGLTSPKLRASKRQPTMMIRASEGETAAAEAAPAAPVAEMEPVPDTFSKICAFEDLPRGDRKPVNALGKSMLLFWYKDTVFCIESRSPAEGAFSEGFTNARLTQDGCIICPTTQSTFELRTGEIKDWYPDNPVLRKLTPIETCRPMEVFPVLVRSDGIYVDVKNGSLGPNFVAPVGKGGSNTSLENNNVYAVEPMMYIQGEDGKEVAVGEEGNGEATKLDPGTVAITIAGVGALALGGSATFVFYENYVGLGLFWLVGFGVAAKVSLDATGALDDDN